MSLLMCLSSTGPLAPFSVTDSIVVNMIMKVGVLVMKEMYNRTWCAVEENEGVCLTILCTICTTLLPWLPCCQGNIRVLWVPVGACVHLVLCPHHISCPMCVL